MFGHCVQAIICTYISDGFRFEAHRHIVCNLIHIEYFVCTHIKSKDFLPLLLFIQGKCVTDTIIEEIKHIKIYLMLLFFPHLSDREQFWCYQDPSKKYIYRLIISSRICHIKESLYICYTDVIVLF